MAEKEKENNEINQMKEIKPNENETFQFPENNTQNDMELMYPAIWLVSLNNKNIKHTWVSKYWPNTVNWVDRESWSNMSLDSTWQAWDLNLFGF